MSHVEKPILEHELSAFVDDQLDPERRAELEIYLAENPAEAARIELYRRHNLLLKKIFDPIVHEPVPIRLRLFTMAAYTRWFKHGSFAASILVAALLGWMVRGVYLPEQWAQVSIAHEAVVAHAVYTPEKLHPVEVSATQEEHLVKWLSKRMGHALTVPQLNSQGYQLVGGRLLPGTTKPAAQLMYQNQQGQRLTLYVSSEQYNNQETAFRYATQGNINVFYWIDGPYGYALSAELNKTELLALAEVVYQGLIK